MRASIGSGLTCFVECLACDLYLDYVLGGCTRAVLNSEPVFAQHSESEYSVVTLGPEYTIIVLKVSSSIWHELLLLIPDDMLLFHKTFFVVTSG